MKKNFRYYALIWLILVAVFNAVVFLVRPVIPGYILNYDATFWVAWAFIIAAFVGNLICAGFAFKADNSTKLFYNLPLITVSWTAVLSMMISGIIIMLIPNCPSWIASIVCIIIFAFNAIAVVKAGWAAEEVHRVDEKIKVKSSFFKNLTIDAEGLVARSKTDEIKSECVKVYEAIRYSDPMSDEALSAIEEKIAVKIGEFSASVESGDPQKVKEAADEIVLLVGDRNRKCKGLKQNG